MRKLLEKLKFNLYKKFHLNDDYTVRVTQKDNLADIFYGYHTP